MKEHFPLLDDYLRDLRNWLLARADPPHDDAEKVCKGIIRYVNGGIRSVAGDGAVDDWKEYREKMKAQRKQRKK